MAWRKRPGPLPVRGIGSGSDRHGGRQRGQFTAAGAVEWAIAGHPGRGAMVGAASGATAGFPARAVQTISLPARPLRTIMDRCLRDRGYDPTGWQ